jgi:hypothetical protein
MAPLNSNSVVARAGEDRESCRLALVVTLEASTAALTLLASAMVRVMGLAQ